MGHDLHVVEVRQVHQVLPLTDIHSFLDHDLPASVVGVDHEAVVGRPDRAKLDLFFQLGQTFQIPLQPAVLVLERGLRAQHVDFQDSEGLGASHFV